MPPTHPHASRLASFLPRMLKLFACAGIVALAGCATQPRQDVSISEPPDHFIRDDFLAGLQSTPLDAWVQDGSSLAADASETDTAASPVPGKTMVSTAMRFLGVKYRYGGDTPGEGFDCSGLVAYAAEKSLGLKLPRSARDQARKGISVDRDELRRGDLVFFNTLGSRNSHVGIYLGDHKFVHAPRTGSAIRVDSMDMAYWRKRYNGARRLTASAADIRGSQAASATDAQEVRKTTHPATRKTAHPAARKAARPAARKTARPATRKASRPAARKTAARPAAGQTARR